MGDTAGDLRTASMCLVVNAAMTVIAVPETGAPAACSIVRRRDGDGGTTAADRDHDRRLLIRAAVDGDGLAGTETQSAGNSDHGRGWIVTEQILT